MDDSVQNSQSNGNANDLTSCSEKALIFYTSTEQEALDILRNHQKEIKTKFAIYRRTGNFGNTDFRKVKHKLLWNTQTIEYTGVPFFVVGHINFDCEFGIDRRLKQLEDPSKGRKLTKKSQCKAQVAITELIEFPDLKIPCNTVWRRTDASKRLKRLLKASVEITTNRRFVIRLPHESEHQTHPTVRRKVKKKQSGDLSQSRKRSKTTETKKKKRKKNATETVLTTLDPGMEEYLNPLVHLAIASQDSNTLKAVRQGFKNVFGHTAAKGVGADNSFAKLPIGFEFAMKGVIEKLDAISTIDFKFNQPYVHIAMQPFLTELQQGRWSCMFCMAVRDSSRQIQLQTFSQPIQIPSPCIAIAYNKTSQEVAQYGFGIDIEETVRLYQPFGIDQDWCSALTGIKLETIISLAAQGLASDYKRELENPSITNVDSFVIMQ